MLLGIVSGQSVPSVEDLVTDNTVVGETKVGETKVDLCVSFNTLLCLEKFSTGETTELARLFVPSHKRLDQGVQI